MKFSDLAPGARFEFEGQVYVKEGPVLAREEATGRLRLIPRYARLRPVREGGGADHAAPGDEARALLDAFYREALAALDDPPEAGRRRLEEAWRRLCATLSLRS